jgi:hypothetical protein
MYDQGEKIVTLAREILRSDELPKLPKSSATRITLSFKMLCFATVLTALGSSAITEWIGEARRPINRYEKTELDALVFYAARQKGLNEEALRRDVLDKLNVASFEDMTERDYQTARGYLQDKAN